MKKLGGGCMKKILTLILFLFLVKCVSGEIVLTEVMYDPVKASDTDLEWIEIYNNGTEKVNLSSWKIDGNNFDDFAILPGEFVVIARELIDGSDIDNDSFESIYGNNDGKWDQLDGNYRAFDGDFSLTNEDRINLTGSEYLEFLEYNSTFGGNGNGHSIEKLNVNAGNSFDNWAESKSLDGTPGYGNVDKEGTNKLDVSVEVKGSSLNLKLLNMSDDLEDNGIQIRPRIENRSILLNLEVNSSTEISQVSAELNGNKFKLTKSYDVNNFSKVYSGNVFMNFFDKPGIYIINLSVKDKFNTTSSFLVEFEYLSLLAISLDEKSLNFGIIEPGSSSEKVIKVINQGNVDVDLELYGSDLENGNYKINVSNINFKINDIWTQLDHRPSLFDFNLTSGIDKNKDLLFKLDLPIETSPSIYSGKINVVGVAA